LLARQTQTKSINPRVSCSKTKVCSYVLSFHVLTLLHAELLTVVYRPMDGQGKTLVWHRRLFLMPIWNTSFVRWHLDGQRRLRPSRSSLVHWGTQNMVVPERCQRASPAKHEPPRARQPGQARRSALKTRPHAMKLIVSSDGVTPRGQGK